MVNTTLRDNQKWKTISFATDLDVYMKCPEAWPCKETHWPSCHPAELKAAQFKMVYGVGRMLIYYTKEQGSGKLGGRPQLIGMGLDKPDGPQTSHFS